MGGRPLFSHSSAIMVIIVGTRNAKVLWDVSSSTALSAENEGRIRTLAPIHSADSTKLMYEE